MKVTFLAPPPALWLALSRDPTLDFLSQLSRTVSILNKKIQRFIVLLRKRNSEQEGRAAYCTAVWIKHWTGRPGGLFHNRVNKTFNKKAEQLILRLRKRNSRQEGRAAYCRAFYTKRQHMELHYFADSTFKITRTKISFRREIKDHFVDVV